MGVAERYKEFNKANYFSRVDVDHILELYIGLDEKNHKAIELRASFSPKKVSGTASIEVNQYSKHQYNTIRFSLCNEEMSGLFFTFCDDLIEQTRLLKENSQGYQTICNRFFQWKKMFVSIKGNLLTEPEIMGLIGEILFLRGNLSERIGIENALRGWSGQELTHKDFSYNDSWYEVKAVSRGKPSVKISSLEQLASDKEGELVVYSLEKMSEAYKGITLNKLILDTVKLFSAQEDKDDFMAKNSLHGYEYNNYYDSLVYEVSSVVRYRVNNNFPKLTKQNVPKEITKASYEILMAEIKDYEIV